MHAYARAVHTPCTHHAHTMHTPCTQHAPTMHRYVAELRRALRPERGHMVSFEGGLFHGGEPIVRGTRYVIAAFLYVDETRGAAQQHGATATASEPPSGSDEADARIVAATLAQLRPLVTPPSEEGPQSKRPRLEAGPGALVQAVEASAEAATFSFGF